MAECQNCKGAASMTLCWPCGKLLRAGLAELPWYLARLAESAYGEAKLGRESAKVSTGEKLPSLPLNERASKLLLECRATLTRWYLAVIPTYSEPVPSGEGCARKLAGEIGALMRAENAAEMLAEVRRLRGECETAIDLPPDLQYVGLCASLLPPVDDYTEPAECGARMYCRQGDTEVVCRRCKSTWDVAELQAWMLSRVDETLRSQAEMWRLLKWIGRDVPRSTFYRLVACEVPCRAYRLADGKLVDDPAPSAVATPVYAYSDVVAALDARDAAEAERLAAGRRKRGRPRKADTPPSVDEATAAC
ncbi:peptidase [Mycobacterium phage Pixie]|uniref:DNA binding protein n=2 Tax=Keshuvirus pixie TaxID=1034114 RepID=G1D4Y2_9CAUD|nr:peptidase [Mycobacterium phage Pixie]AEK09883.1 DNA binding protein [Mycobacterium phage Pixie]AOT23809.1 DNA binding protein [Mycobacterium phage TBond007]